MTGNVAIQVPRHGNVRGSDAEAGRVSPLLSQDLHQPPNFYPQCPTLNPARYFALLLPKNPVLFPSMSLVRIRSKRNDRRAPGQRHGRLPLSRHRPRRHGLGWTSSRNHHRSIPTFRKSRNLVLCYTRGQGSFWLIRRMNDEVVLRSNPDLRMERDRLGYVGLLLCLLTHSDGFAGHLNFKLIRQPESGGANTPPPDNHLRKRGPN